jgi:hypothetical protein
LYNCKQCLGGDGLNDPINRVDPLGLDPKANTPWDKCMDPKMKECGKQTGTASLTILLASGCGEYSVLRHVSGLGWTRLQ